MTRTEAPKDMAASIEAQAASWLVRRDRGLSATEQQAFEAWRDTSTRHRVEWLRLEAAWSKADRLAALKSDPVMTGRRSSDRPRRASWVAKANRAGPVVQAMAALSACAALLIGGHSVSTQVWGSPLSTPVGGRTVEPLADGSRVEINTDTRIRVSVNGLRRKVWIDQGEAYFDIAPDTSRPFIIQAGERQIVVVGTRFSVYRDHDDVRVRVTEGLVDVKADAGRVVVRARAGDEVKADGVSLTRVYRGQEALEDDMSWRTGRLVFQNATLAEVATQFNRYNTRKLTVVDSDVASIRVGGAYSATNVSGFADLLRDSYDLRTDVRAGEIIISR